MSSSSGSENKQKILYLRLRESLKSNAKMTKMKWQVLRVPVTKSDKGEYPLQCTTASALHGREGISPTRQGSSNARRIWTWCWEDDILLTYIKVSQASFYVERDSYVRVSTSGKRSYGPKVRRLLNAHGRLAKWGGLCEHKEVDTEMI